MPRYEYSAGGSHKFWEIEVHGSEYTVTYGRIGTVGQTSTKSFADAATAKAKADAAAKSKAAKGYVLVAAEAVASERAEVEERLVVADRLQEEGDPRGRLIPLHHGMATKSGKDRSELKKQETALLQEHAGALLGPLSEEAAGACAKVEWKLGYWDRLKIASDYDHQDVETGELVKRCLSHPSAARLDHLHIGIPDGVWDGESRWQDAIDAIASVGAPSLTSLELADHDDYAEVSWCDIGDLTRLWKACPNLEKLVIRGVGIALGEIHAPRLRHLVLMSGGLPAEPVRRISAAKLPALKHLEIYFGTPDYGASADIDDCAGILAGTGLPALEVLGLKNGTFMGDVVASVCIAPIVKQLRVLDLSMGTMTDDQAAPLVPSAPAFRHLAKLDLSDNYLSPATCGAIERAIPGAVVNGQKTADEYGGEAYYYTSISE